MKKTTKYRCVCGYIHDGDTPPAACPKCGAPPEKFTRLDEAAADLIERSRRTNMLHARIIDLARQIEKTCYEGIEDNLDPGCADVFRKTVAACYDIMKLSMTELQGHVNKGKWG